MVIVLIKWIFQRVLGLEEVTVEKFTMKIEKLGLMKSTEELSEKIIILISGCVGSVAKEKLSALFAKILIL